MTLGDFSTADFKAGALRVASKFSEAQLETDKHKLTIDDLAAIDDVTLSRGANSILLLPLNWRSNGEEEIYAESTDSIAKLFSQENIPSESLSPLTAQTILKQERYADWVAPTLFVSSLLLSQNQVAASITLNVIANYVTDQFKGIKDDPAVKLQIVHTTLKGKTTRKISYEGPASGLAEVAKVVAEFRAEK